MSSAHFDCSQTNVVAVILVLWSIHAVFRVTDFSSDPFDFSSSKMGCLENQLI